jgi:hypothetical protein
VILRELVTALVEVELVVVVELGQDLQLVELVYNLLSQDHQQQLALDLQELIVNINGLLAVEAVDTGQLEV